FLTAIASSLDIAAGSDGALWFTDEIDNKIGRITTAGAVAEFTIPTAASNPIGIAAGPDGALWFTEFGANAHKIGRITTAGAFTEFPIPDGLQSIAIAAGPDGALWFTAGANRIGRITIAGVITEFTVCTPGILPVGIAAGPDAALWFTESSGNAIGRITTSGGGPGVAISKSAPASVGSGQNLTYTLTYGNTSPSSATGVSITDTVPAGTTFVSATGGGALSAGVVAWNIGALDACVTGQTVSFTVAVTATSGTIVNSTYSIQASGVSPISGTAVSTTVTPVVTNPVLTISKTAASSVVPGQTLTYKITYGNTGNGDATGVLIQDTVPSGTAFVSATGGGTFAAGVVSWNLGSVNAGVTGQTVFFTVAVTATSGSVNNAAYSIRANGVAPVVGSPVATVVTPGSPLVTTTVGNFVPTPNAADAFLFPTPYTDVDLVNPASFAGNLTTATFAWSNSSCAAALKIKFFRPSGQNLVFLTERGPFDSSTTTVALSPAVPIQTGDLIGISHLTTCGNPVGAIPGLPAGYIAFAGDVASTVALSSGLTVRNFTLAVQASGPAGESTQGTVVVVASIPGVPPALFKTGFQMHNSTASILAGRLVFHPQGTAGSGADSSLAFSLAPGQTQSFADLPPAMRLAGPQIGSLDVVMPAAVPAPVIAARVFNDAGASGTTGFTMGLTSPEAVLGAGDHGVLFAPANTARFRMNIGVRTGSGGATITVTRRDASGATLQTLTKSYAANFFEQIGTSAFLEGAVFQSNDSITVQVTAGSITVYAATADNITQDPSIQFATRAP
ncbi:MAG TPA: hypothetical protein VER78_00425, partial [Thermoanaerobaculia bacterium]|nr:hypothetical protein [Thermoanaerobaculia bacterium]